jgi:hypothetical protein
MDPQTLLRILYAKPEMTDTVAYYVIEHRLPNWEDAREAKMACAGRTDHLATGYWEYMVHVLGGDPEANWPTPS